LSDRSRIRAVAIALLASSALVPWALAAQDAPTPAPASAPAAPAPTQRIHELLACSHEDVRTFNEHLMVLASEWMDGRLPGTKGMERAMDYVEWGFRTAGLTPPVKAADGSSSFRQPFSLGDRKTFSNQALSASVGGKSIEFALDKDWTFTSLGPAGDVTGSLVFVGYGIDNAEHEYRTFNDSDSLEGKIAVLLRFEPMDEAGKSRWSERGWSAAAGFQGKLANVLKRKPAAVLLVNTPGADDDRIKSLKVAGSAMSEVPVAVLSPDAADALVRLADPEHRSLVDLRKLVDEKGMVVSWPEASLRLAATMTSSPLMAENVVGLLPGRGALKDQIIVMGGHLDHLGYGEFGSRSGPGPLHPGADDNASGSAGIMLLAELLGKEYAKLPAEQPLRSILFIAFSAEESGLNGSRHYVNNPLFPARDHVLMFNYDMIGRMKNERLSVSGSGSAKGLHELVEPIYAKAKADYGLEVVASKAPDWGGSDQASFLQVGIPALFGILADFHQDYHTPRDVSDLINRESSVKSVWLFRDLALAVSQHPERFEFDGGGGPMRGSPMRVRLGVRSADTEDKSGITINEITAAGAAEKAGFKVGDKLIKWNKNNVTTREEFVGFLRAHEPGDEVQAVVVRDGEQITLFVKFPPKA
jgi:Peptidase family M28/PDZ domain/PA domain